MDWFRHDVGMVRHPRVASLAHHIHKPRLVAYAHVCAFYEGVAEHAETGHLDDITDELIESWAEWPGKLGVLATAMREAGIIETATVHGWLRRHEYAMRERDRKRAERAQAARNSRAENAPAARKLRGNCAAIPRPRPITDEITSVISVGASAPTADLSSDPDNSFALSSEAPSPPAVDLPADLLRRWNALAAELGLAQAEKLTPKRSLAAAVRIREGLLERWDEFAAGLRGSRYHLGQNDDGWRANFDWLLRPDKWLQLVERASAPPPPPPSSDGPTRRPLSRAERNKADMDTVDWDAIDREREALGLDNPKQDCHQANGSGPGSGPLGDQGARSHTRDPP